MTSDFILERAGEIAPSASLESNVWNSPKIVESSPERFTFWPQNKINYGDLEKNKIVYAEERISIDDGENVEEINETESSDEIQAATTISHPPLLHPSALMYPSPIMHT